MVENLLGRRNEKLSSSREWRYGSKGSLVIQMVGEKRGLWYNFENGESGNLLLLVQRETGLSIRGTLSYLTKTYRVTNDSKVYNEQKSLSKKLNESEISKTVKYARKLVAESKPISGTIVETYLKNRAINNLVNDRIRYHPQVYTNRAAQEKYLPAMLVIGLDQEGKVQCVQATYLDPKTKHKADLEVKKRTYGSPSGALVLLAKDSSIAQFGPTFIAEGIETGLSIRDAIKEGRVLVTLGKTNFLSVDLQSIGKKAVFCLDNDGVKNPYDDTIHKAVSRVVAAGKEVLISMPDQDSRQSKTDFNDIAKNYGAAKVQQYLSQAKLVLLEEFSYY